MVIKTLLRIPFSAISVFFSANLSLAAGKIARINLSQASGMILQNHRLIPFIFSANTAALGSLKVVGIEK
jgi:hypothetical protein